MGDVAMTVPVLRALLQQYPNVKVTVVSKAFFKPFFDTIPGIHFFAADTEGTHKGFFGLLKLYRQLKKLKVYAVADLHNVLRSKIVTFLFSVRGKKTAVTNKVRTERKALTRPQNKDFRPLEPVVMQHAAVFAQLGFPINMSEHIFPAIQPLTPDITGVTGQKNETWIGIAPFAQHRSKIYPLDLMKEVVNTLAGNSNYKLFLFGGGKAEKETLKNFAQGYENIVVIAGTLKFFQEISLMSHLDVMLSMDSGNAHIAAMLGVKVVTLWGATHPYAGYAPFNQPLSNALTSDREKYPMLPTSVYGNKKVAGYEDAMRTITPQMVINKITEVLSATHK